MYEWRWHNGTADDLFRFYKYIVHILPEYEHERRNAVQADSMSRAQSIHHVHI